MFLTGAFGIGAGFNAADPNEERDPPHEATPITFPTHATREGKPWTSESPPPVFEHVLARVTRPADISDRHLQALNFTVLPPCDVQDLVPFVSSGTGPLSTNTDAPAETTLEAAAMTRREKDYQDRVAELQVDNDTGFRIITRNVAQGVRPPRLAHMRKFFEGLENMSQYWDTSLDQYYDVPAKGFKRQRLDSPPGGSVDAQASSSDGTAQSEEEGRAHERYSYVYGSDDEGDQKLSTSVDGTRLRRRYKGRRTGNGHDMPDQYRSDTVRSFIEGSIWPFRTTILAPRMMPIVQFGKLNLPVRQTAAVYSMPEDRIKARQGWLRGPILAVQVRSEIEFEMNEDGQDQDTARLDLMREIGGLLHLAQERRREGQTMIKPGEGKWWTTVPRWGGGPGGEVQNEIGNSDIVALVEAASEANKENVEKKEDESKRARKKKGLAGLWKELKCGKGVWDSKTEYQAIGSDPESAFDDIFMISSLNHHISIIRARIHDMYLEYLATGTLPDPLPEDRGWSSPMLQRSQWLDLFDVEQRVEAFRAIWAIMTYMTRLQKV